jgi:putative proteasome-type protease
VTFCLGINVPEGLVGVADTRVLSGSECISARKVTIYQQDGRVMFLLTSGLRSLSDKALTYFDEVVTESGQQFDRLCKAVNTFATQVRHVAQVFAELAEMGKPNGASPV